MEQFATMPENEAKRFAVLTYEQVVRLGEVLSRKVEIHGRGNFPTIQVVLKDLVEAVSSRLRDKGVKLRDIRLNGGAASFVLCQDKNYIFNDLDLIFGVDLSCPQRIHMIFDVVMDALTDFLPEGVSKNRMCSATLKDAYVKKLVKVTDETNSWSLISLSNDDGRNVELKFVDTMKRPFEFSIDSFQINLDSLLSFFKLSTLPIKPNFFPSVLAESVYGDIGVALHHLDNRLIATRNPEEIRGGGLLKYCYLLVKRYTPEDRKEIRSMERYMCSRFFIDFGDLDTQVRKLQKYLQDHFQGDERVKCEYLRILYRTIASSTVCLMNHERKQTLMIIEQMANNIEHGLLEMNYYYRPMPTRFPAGNCYYKGPGFRNHHHTHHHHHNHSRYRFYPTCSALAPMAT
ncbi:terminal nucleotidyltransferase 5C-like [Dendronephthya gigantea]|uniref:terminal nucleotidyltransferase 5C-like n=1 Tax=Dendronephthya gigantea TaxID=151771 RepID=UPI00106BEB0F|nr:terminal nucleotidyltransferase 5C-like [Dendronephthya gigantea]